VTLSGSVASEAERASFEQTASRVPGVTSVNNYLTVTKTDKQ
jgi:osmotically-inducible protein OsmY